MVCECICNSLLKSMWRGRSGFAITKLIFIPVQILDFYRSGLIFADNELINANLKGEKVPI